LGENKLHKLLNKEMKTTNFTADDNSEKIIWPPSLKDDMFSQISQKMRKLQEYERKDMEERSRRRRKSKNKKKRPS
jgi:hypothetical protein